MTRHETKQSNKAEVKPRTHHNGLDFFFFTFRWLARLLARNFDGETLVCVDPPKHIDLKLTFHDSWPFCSILPNCFFCKVVIVPLAGQNILLLNPKINLKPFSHQNLRRKPRPRTKNDEPTSVCGQWLLLLMLSSDLGAAWSKNTACRNGDGPNRY